MRGRDEVVVGTANVNGLGGSMAQLMDWAVNRRVDVVAVQETKLSADNWRTVSNAAKASGYVLHAGTQGVDAQHRPKAGTVILSRWPTEAIQGQVVKAHHPGCRPFLLVNIYSHSGNQHAAAEMLQKVMDWLASTGETAMIIGDFNLEANQSPIAGARMTGRWYDVDELVLGDQRQKGTRRVWQTGEYTGRVIDYALVTPELYPVHRIQDKGVADHNFVSYNILVAAADSSRGRKCFPAPRRALSEEEVTDAEWARRWGPREEDFRAHLLAGDLTEAWNILSNTAEEAMAKEGGRGAKRSEALIPRVPGSLVSTKAPTVQGLRERQLRRLLRRIAELRSKPTLRLSQKVWRSIRDLGLLAATSLEEAEELAFSEAINLAEESAKTRISKWKEEVRENKSRLERWIKQQWEEGPMAKDLESSPHPADRLQQEAEVWRQQWMEEPPHHAQSLQRFGAGCSAAQQRGGGP